MKYIKLIDFEKDSFEWLKELSFYDNLDLDENDKNYIKVRYLPYQFFDWFIKEGYKTNDLKDGFLIELSKITYLFNVDGDKKELYNLSNKYNRQDFFDFLKINGYFNDKFVKYAIKNKLYNLINYLNNKN